MSGYIGTQPVPQATQTRDSFTATSGQVSFSCSGYTPNFLDVFLNGVKLAAADYTATNGSDVVLATGAATGDILEVVAYTAFDTANVTGATNFTVTGAFTSQGIDDNGNAVALTIDSSENVLIGNTDATPYTRTSGNAIAMGDGLISSAQSGGNAAIFNRMTNDGSIVGFRKDGVAVGSIGTYNDYMTVGSGDTGLLMYNGGDVIRPHNMSLNSARDNAIDLGSTSDRFKDLYLSGGVYLGGTGSTNKLSDYEEGTFTPSLDFGSGNTGITYGSASGKFVKVGNLVTVWIYLYITNKGTSTGQASVGGLPFAINNPVGVFSPLGDRGRINTGGEGVSAYISGGSAFPLYHGGFDGAANSEVGEGNFQNNSEVDIVTSYFTNS